MIHCKAELGFVGSPAKAEVLVMNVTEAVVWLAAWVSMGWTIRRFRYESWGGDSEKVPTVHTLPDEPVGNGLTDFAVWNALRAVVHHRAAEAWRCRHQYRPDVDPPYGADK